jgi:ubiquinone/menaquinone biosynthesis C-methylase UbiE
MSAEAVPQAEGSVYVMGRTTEEYDRLRGQAKILEPITASVLERAGLSVGMSCLDVGSGPGEVMRLMADRVGPSGRVVGLDVDGRLGREAADILASRGYTQCTFIEGDLQSLEFANNELFDFVFARIVLQHLDDAILGLRNMYRRVKPRGRIVIQDYTFRTIDHYPSFGAADECLRMFFAVYEKVGRETRMGVKLPSHFIEAGIGPPDGTDVGGCLLPIAKSAQMLAAVYRSVLPLALKFGITTEERSTALLSELGSNQPQSGYFLWPLLLSAWKTKPA